MGDAVYQIRSAVAADIERVLALDGQIEFLPHWTTTHYLGALAVVEHGARHEGTQRCFFVASSGDELAGLAVGRVTAAGAEVLAELESVGVADAARRKGIGKRLCGAVIGWALEQGASEIELEVRSRSEGAIAMYSGLGFLVTGMRARYYGSPADNAVLMRLGLAPGA